MWIHKYNNMRYISINGKKIPEHRYLMEQYLGRSLERFNEVVHHINGDRLDNRIDNLRVMQRGDHKSLHLLDKKTCASTYAKQSETMKRLWKEGKYDHLPPASEEAKKRMSIAVKESWAAGRHNYVLTDESRKRRSDVIKRHWAEGVWKNRKNRHETIS